jgi:hypothetical protein
MFVCVGWFCFFSLYVSVSVLRLPQDRLKMAFCFGFDFNGVLLYFSRAIVAMSQKKYVFLAGLFFS